MCKEKQLTKNILITGASGFIGSFMVETAINRGYKVWAGIRKDSSKEFLPQDGIFFVELDYLNIEKLANQLQNIDYIIHCAGITKSKKSEDFDRVNFQYAVNLCEAIKLTEGRLKKFVQISSLSVMDIGDESNISSFSSTDTPKPNTHYGRSKLKFEQYLQSQQKVPYIILRPTGVYGPRETDYLMMLKSIKKGINIKAGFTPQQLTFIYIQDLVDVAFSALESQIENETYLVSDGNTYTDEEYTAIIKELLPKRRTINIRIPLCLLKAVSYISWGFSFLRRKPSTLNPDKYKIMKQRNWKCNIDKTISDLGFEPKYNLHQGLKASISWYRANGWLG